MIVRQVLGSMKHGDDAPLVLDNTVALATLVKLRLAFTLQLAINQNMQNVAANLAVSSSVKGSNSSNFFPSSENTEGARNVEATAATGAPPLSEAERA